MEIRGKFFKRKPLLLACSLLPSILFAQVGVNTENPQGTFHVDPLKNNNVSGAPTSAQIKDDVLITPDGNVSLGTADTNPKIMKVDIQTDGVKAAPITGFILQDGNQATTKILTSDATGNATWKYAKPQGAIIGEFKSSTGVLVSMNPALSGTFGGLTLSTRPLAGFVRTGGEIVLPPGRWWLKMSLYLSTQANGHHGEQAWVRTTIGDSSSGSNKSTDLEPSYTLASNNIWKGSGGVIVGSFIVNNKSSVAKTYYVMVGWIDTPVPNTQKDTVFKTGMSGGAENTLVAYRILE
ncbi:hypothetical protein LJC00_03690 [Dysgonomonas sp. OttesenSCG-928-M03]|nr:hypothetical protein [Dysgonomonas sp. OttesenSCG-928-M03]